MAMTLATLRALTRQLIGDPQGSTYSPEMYQDAINFACKEYAKKTGVTYIETGVTMDAYTGLCTIPTSYLRINRVLVGDVLSYGTAWIGKEKVVQEIYQEVKSRGVHLPAPWRISHPFYCLTSHFPHWMRSLETRR